MGSLWLIPFGLMLLIAKRGAKPLYTPPTKADKTHNQPLQTFRPFNIAHRGSNGELPEDSAAAHKVKWPNGKKFEDMFVETLKNIDLPKLLLIDDRNVPTQDTNQEITSDTYFDNIKHYVVDIGPWRDTIVPALNNNLQKPTDLVDREYAHGLQVHPYTYRIEN